MARDYEAELAAVEAKRERILKAKEAHEQRMYTPIGKDVVAVFPQLVDMKTKERQHFIRHLGDLYEAAHRMPVREEPADAAEPAAQDVRPDAGQSTDGRF